MQPGLEDLLITAVNDSTWSESEHKEIVNQTHGNAFGKRKEGAAQRSEENIGNWTEIQQ